MPKSYRFVVNTYEQYLDWCPFQCPFNVDLTDKFIIHRLDEPNFTVYIKNNELKDILINLLNDINPKYTNHKYSYDYGKKYVICCKQKEAYYSSDEPFCIFDGYIM